MSQCIGEPIPFLRLERYLLDELDREERAHVQQHLRACEVCRECEVALRSDAGALKPLPALIGLARARKHMHPVRSSLAVLAMAAIVLLMLRVGKREVPVQVAGPIDSQGIKGGELTLELVREQRGDVAVDPSKLALGDRFMVQVSCPPAISAYWDLVVFQGDEAFFPLTPEGKLRCGNHITLPGAFSFTEEKRARVCVVLDSRRAIERASITPRLPETSACVEVRPVR